MTFAGGYSWNAQIKEYFLDAAGYADTGFAEISANFDDWPEDFDHGGNVARSFNDALRIGLNALGYGYTVGDFDEITQEFSTLESNWGGSRSLNRMLREWANDQVSGVLSEHFDDLDENFDSIPLRFEHPPRVSINTALRLALTSGQTPTQLFEDLSTLFDQETRTFNAIDAAFAIASASDQFAGSNTFGDATWADFDEVGAAFEDIAPTFNGEDRVGVITTFDREDRRFEMIN